MFRTLTSDQKSQEKKTQQVENKRKVENIEGKMSSEKAR